MFLRGRRLRLRRLRRQLWPDVCDLLIASIRVGLSSPRCRGEPGRVRDPRCCDPRSACSPETCSRSGRFETSLDRLKSSLADPIGDRIVETLRWLVRSAATELVGVLRALSTSVRADGRAARRGRGATVVDSWRSRPRRDRAVGHPQPARHAAGRGNRRTAHRKEVIVICVGAGVSVIAFQIMVRIGRAPGTSAVVRVERVSRPSPAPFSSVAASPSVC